MGYQPPQQAARPRVIPGYYAGRNQSGFYDPRDALLQKGLDKKNARLDLEDDAAANRQRLDGYLDERGRSPYTGANPYQQDWRSLIGQLQGQASGTAPSVAQAQYLRASQDSQAAIGGMARASARPGAGRAAMIQQARVGQGLAGGSAQAIMEEQAMARQQLGAALSGAGQADWQRDQSNQQAWLQMMAMRLGLTQQELQAQLEKDQQPTGFEKFSSLAARAAAAYFTYGGSEAVRAAQK